MITCPCCSDQLLRHVRDGSVYLFCRTCWAEMPGDTASLLGTLALEQRAISNPNEANPAILRSGNSHLLDRHSYSLA